jgi:uncharacterized membrane protein YedE/YeeE
MGILISFFVGLIFSVGLSISGMVNPKKVIGFLDVFRAWDPSLLWVMVGAIGTNFIFFKIILKRNRPLLSLIYEVPKKIKIDKKLIIGSMIFGIGWGLAGICPGPALSNILFFNEKVIVFVLSMLGGMIVYKVAINEN